MTMLADSNCQRRQHLKSDALDIALQRMFPNIPADARRFLRRPLARWHDAAFIFLRSPLKRADDFRFSAALFSISASSPEHRQSETAAMFCGLHRAVGAALVHAPAGCPHRYAYALLLVVEWLFGDAERSQ